MIPVVDSKFEILKLCLSALNREGKFKILGYLALNIVLAFLDLIGVALIGVLSTVAFNGFTSQELGNRTSMAVKILNLEELEFEKRIAVLSILILLLFVAKSIVGLIAARRLTFYLARRSAQLSENLIRQFFNSSPKKIRSRGIQEMTHTLTTGPSILFVGVIGSAAQVITDGFLLMILFFGLFFIDPLASLLILLLYGIVAWVQVRFTENRVRKYSQELTDFTIASRTKLFELTGLFRELFVRNRVNDYVRELTTTQYRAAENSARLSFYSVVSKYVFELILVLSISSLLLIQLSTQSVSRTVALTGMFIAASSRIMPAIMRIQQGLIRFTSSGSQSKLTLELIKQFGPRRAFNIDSESTNLMSDFIPKVSFDKVCFSYENTIKPIVKNVSFEIESGEVVLFRGASGIGKSTVIDLMLGLLRPQSGQVTISDQPPLSAIATWPNHISYVPQDSILVEGTIEDNLKLGLNGSMVSLDNLRACLEVVGIDKNLMTNSSELLEFHISEMGRNLSGGQRQRISLARSILNRPGLLILDEAMSALDELSELQTLKSIRRMLPYTTIIIVSHRASVAKLSHRSLTLKKSGFQAIENM